MPFVNIGLGTLVNTDKVFAVVAPEAAAMRRLKEAAASSGTLYDATQGRRCRSMFICEENSIILSPMETCTLVSRLNFEPPETKDKKKSSKDGGNDKNVK